MTLNSSLHTLSASVVLLLALASCTPEQATTTAATPAQLESAAATPAAPAPVAEPVAPAPVQAQAPAPCATCGVVRSITAVVQAGSSTGLGAAIGAVAGGLAGNQVGGGSGNTIATAAGVIGGAVLGNTIEKNRNAGTMYEVIIDMEGGTQQTIMVPDATGISQGSAVNVQNGNISLR